ncbi:hypothetical protein [Hymenobacter negativus]|uniref:Outer membrane protein beta-barrel domain-containing protein n=1 Tax=Hymenobacter negativus TaxID=2795026 RepID=A0ABS3QBA2_9BACT|nr:hypothetical protein [Hymenobacter negativus]MBO2008531.1 hypothetical protein [Hymenobacter negativus]
MKKTVTLLALLSAAGVIGAQRTQAQCHVALSPAFYQGCHHQRDSCAVEKPLVPGRWAAYMGLLGLADRRGTPYVGGDLEGGYWVHPRWNTGLRGTITGQMPAHAVAEGFGGVLRPLVMLYSVTWSNSLLLSDGPTWRLALQAGIGLGGANLYDKNRQVPVKGSCGCTTAEKIASATSPITEIGLAATYKLRSNNAPWLTLRGGYRQWADPAPFATFNQFSAYVLSVGVSLPDAPSKRK